MSKYAIFTYLIKCTIIVVYERVNIFILKSSIKDTHYSILCKGIVVE